MFTEIADFDRKAKKILGRLIAYGNGAKLKGVARFEMLAIRKGQVEMKTTAGGTELRFVRYVHPSTNARSWGIIETGSEGQAHYAMRPDYLAKAGGTARTTALKTFQAIAEAMGKEAERAALLRGRG